MPVFNAERFLNEAMESILSQTFRDFEFLIIDDCSTDRSVEIVKSYNDPRIRLVRNNFNMGVADTLNRGIELASCELIARMDADDFSYPERLEKQFAYLQRHPDCVLLYTFSRKISSDRSQIRDRVFPVDHLYFNLLFHCPIRHPSVMFKRSIVKEVGMYDKTFVEDFNLWFRLSRKYDLHCLEEILFEYRETDTSTSRVVFKSESEDAYYKQVASNIHFYTGAGFSMTNEEIFFLRGRWSKQQGKNASLGFYINCFQKLDFVTACVLKHCQTPSRKVKSIKEASLSKRRKLVSALATPLSRAELVKLLYKLGYWRLLLEFATKKPFNKKSNSFHPNAQTAK